MHSRAGETVSILREFGGLSGGDHPAAFADHLDNLLGAAFELAPDRTMCAVRDVVTGFRMPGHGMPGFERAAARMALGGIYNLRIHHDDVLQPVLRHLKVLEIDGLGPEGLQAQEELGLFMGGLDAEALKFDEKLAARKARMAARAAG
jgi:acyl-[acyl-carrier-protein] desaturase